MADGLEELWAVMLLGQKRPRIPSGPFHKHIRPNESATCHGGDGEIVRGDHLAKRSLDSRSWRSGDTLHLAQPAAQTAAVTEHSLHQRGGDVSPRPCTRSDSSCHDGTGRVVHALMQRHDSGNLGCCDWGQSAPSIDRGSGKRCLVWDLGRRDQRAS